MAIKNINRGVRDGPSNRDALAAGQQVAWTMGGFTSATTYVVRVGSVKSGTVTADADGNVSSTLAATGTAEVQVKVSAT